MARLSLPRRYAAPARSFFRTALALLALLFLASVPAPARAQVAGTDCGCGLTGAWIDAEPGVKPFLAANGDSASASPKFRVIVTPVGQNVPPIVDIVPLVNGVPGASRLQTSGLFWGFSPDQDRFLIWSVTGSFPNVAIQADLYDLTTTPATKRRSFGGAFTSKRFRFSDDGRYLLMAATAFGGTQIQLEWVKAATGDVRLATSFPVNNPPGIVGDEFDVAGWGYGPDSSRVVYAYLSGGLPFVAVDNLEDGSQAPVIQAQTHISAFWQFSPCGDVFGVANQRFAGQMEVTAWKTRDGAPVGSTGFSNLNVSFATTATKHQASVPGSTADLGNNGGGAACTNLAPTPNFTVSGNLQAGQALTFIDTSTDTDGTIVSRSWDFGDGASSSATNSTHVYAAGGAYNVKLTVTDSGGASASVTKPVTVCSAPSASSGKILYTTSPLRGDLYALNMNGSGTVRITNGDETGFAQVNGLVADADFSPDGTRIAWVADNLATFAGDGSGLVVANADGSNRTLLVPRANDFTEFFAPRWTPDGRAILFFLQDNIGTQNPRYGLYLVDADGTNLRPLNNTAFPGGFSGVPTCGGGGGRVPDACWTLAVSTAFGNDFEIWKIQADGSGFTKLTDGPADTAPRFSPDGAKLTFIRGFSPQTVHVANADGSNARSVSTPPASTRDERPFWSPDGRQIAFTRARFPTGSISVRDLIVAGSDGCYEGVVAPGTPSLPFKVGLSWAPGSQVQGPGSISGRVFFGGLLTNPSAAGIVVTASWSGGSASATTAADGTYTIVSIPIGVTITSISASLPGYVWASPGPLSGFRDYRFPDFTGHASGVYLGMLRDEFIVQGTVRDPNGDPVPGIMLAVSGPSPLPGPVTTGADGRFSFSLKPLTYYGLSPLTPTYDYSPFEVSQLYGSYEEVRTQDFVATLIVPPAVTPPILFSSDRDTRPSDPQPNFEIYAAEPDGSGTVRLTRDLSPDLEPAWSPNGAKIAFVRELGGTPTLHVMNKDGTGAASLGIEGRSPAWSPDGTRLAFARNGGILVVDATGANETPLTSVGFSYDDHPAWSRDGGRIVFEREDFSTPGTDLVEIDVASAIETPLLVRPGRDRSPAWSPDGTTLAVGFEDPTSGNTELTTVSADGSAVTPLGVQGSDPSWSSDGRLVYTRAGGGIGVIDVVTLATQDFPTPPGATELQPDCLALSAADSDGDGVIDILDNCPFTPNGANEEGIPGIGNQDDRGGVGLGTAPDGIGDACQCGDVNADGFVGLADAILVQRSLLQPPTASLARPERCDVTGDGACQLADALKLRRALLRPPQATIAQQCAPAVP